MSLPPCPKCHPGYTYEDGTRYVHPRCIYEWNETDVVVASDNVLEVKDANGVVSQNGDTVALIKDPKVKGSSMAIEQGTEVKDIRL